MNKIFLTTVFLTMSLIASDLFVQKGHYQITYDNLKLPENESMGLLGTSYLYDFNDSYIGLGIYSAVSGHRGGFFTGGLETGYRYNLVKNLSIEAGLFIGGGGGGAAPQGGGLMVRSHVELLYDIDNFKIGLGFSKVKFPNGNIDSNQIYAQINIPFETVHKKNINSPMIIDDLENFMKKTGKNIGWSDTYFAVTLQRYMIPSGVKNTSGALVKKDMDLVGFEYGKDYYKHIFAFMEAAGAAGGGADGYAEMLGGVGYKKQFSKNFGAFAKVALGAAGGGKVDTGGGTVHKESIGLYRALNKKLTLSAEVGHMGAFDGDFKATTLNFGFNYHSKSLSIGKNLYPLATYESFGDHEWNIKLSNQRYFSDKSIRKNGSDSSSLSLIGFEIDSFLDKHYYLLGKALGAYSGHSGGYAVGLVGFGGRIVMREHINLFAQMSLGVAGGGSVATGSGGVYQPMVGIEYKINNSFGIHTSFGIIKAISGDLNTFVSDIGFSYKFRSMD